MLSAYVPCFNNAATVRRAVESVLAQSSRPEEVVVVDDGSSDDSMARLRGLPVRIVRHDINLGRGAARARGMREVLGDFVLSVDAIAELPVDFAARALRWLEAPSVAAVCGRIIQRAPRSAVERWRGRHLFKLGQPGPFARRATLSSGGLVARAGSVAAVGGYDSTLRHGEDAELGARLLAAGHEVIYEPELPVYGISEDSVGKVLERYWRWNVGMTPMPLRAYFRMTGFALRSMIAADFAQRDPLAAWISFACPHYCYVKSKLLPGPRTVARS